MGFILYRSSVADPLGTTFSLVFNLVSGRYGGAEKLREILKLRREEISGKGTGLTIKNDPSRKGRRVRQEKPTSVQRQIAGSAGGPMIPSISLVAGGVGNGTEESGGQSLGRIGGSIENTEIDPSLPASMAEIDLIPPFPFPLDAISFDPTKTTLQPSNQSAITSTIPAFPSTSQTPWNLSSAEKRPIGRPKGVKNKSHVPVEEVKEKRRIAQIKRREKQRAERVRLGLEVGEVESSERAGEVDLAATRGRKRGRPRKYRPEEEEGGMGGQYTQFEGDEDLGRPQLGERGGEENAHLTLQDGQHIGEEDMMAYPQQIIPGESQHADDGGMQDLQTLATQHHHGLDNIDVAQLQAMGDVAGIEEMQAGMQQYTNDEQDHQHHAVMQGDINMMDLPPLQEGGEEMHQRHPEMTDEEAGIMQYVHDYTITLDALERARATLVDEGQQQHVTGEQE